MNYDCINNKLLLKLFDCLIRPIVNYGSEIWICGFNIKESVLEKLPFEKLHNKFCKYLLGVHIEDRLILHQDFNLAQKGF